jgi:predicted nucleic acid-binding protein
VSSLYTEDGRTARMRARLVGSVRAISVVTVGEVRSAARQAGWGDARTLALDAHLAEYLLIPIDSAVANEWAVLRSRCVELDRAAGDNDLWIAATARRLGIPLATLDRRQGAMPGLTVVLEDGSETTLAP